MSKIKAVIGANWGDEGKGLMTDYFADIAKQHNESCVVVCNNGGAQRGHTVTSPDGERHVFQHIGSGTMAGADTYLSPYFIVNPMIFEPEYRQLIRYRCNVMVNPGCLCSTPYDMIANQILEESRGDQRHGSCGIGIWETIVRSSIYHLPIGQLAEMNGCDIDQYLLKVRDYYLMNRLKDIKISEWWMDTLTSESLRSHYIDDLFTMISCIDFVEIDCLKEYENIIFENGQGLLLDQDSVDKIHSTPSKTGSANIYDMLDRVFDDYALELCYVTRSYITRHGAGPFLEECPVNEINPSIDDKTNVWNEHQGSIRYGKLNFDDLYKRCEQDVYCECYTGKIVKMSIAMTHLNEYNLVFEQNKDRITYTSNSLDRTGVECL